MARPACRTGRQSVRRTAHPNQRAHPRQFPTEPRFLRSSHEARASLSDCGTKPRVCNLRAFLCRGAVSFGFAQDKCCASANQSTCISCPILFERSCEIHAIENSKGGEPAE